MKKYILILTLIIFTACTSNKQVKIQKIPAWYIQEIQNDENFIYGSSEAFNLKEAKLQALSDMSARLIVQVDSSFSSSTSTNGNLYSKELKKDIKQTSKQVKFTNYKIYHSKNVNNTYYMVLKVNRKQLFINNKNDFDLLHKNINEVYLNSNTSTLLEQINKLQNLRKDITKAKELLYILKAINNSFSYFKYLDLYIEIENKIQLLKNNLVINVNSNLQKNLFKNKVINLLNNNSYKVQKSSNINIELHHNVNKSKARTWYIVKVTSNVNIKSKNKIVSNNIIFTVGRSSSSYSNALVSASNSFDKKLKKLGVDKLLFN